MKKCPFCAEDIQDEAIVCKHCGRDLVATAPPPTVVIQQAPQRLWNPGIAALLSLVIPGAGQMYKGEVGSGIIWLLLVIGGYMLFILPGLVLHLVCIVTASQGDPYPTAPATGQPATAASAGRRPTRQGAAFGCPSCGKTVRVGQDACPHCEAALS